MTEYVLLQISVNTNLLFSCQNCYFPVVEQLHLFSRDVILGWPAVIEFYIYTHFLFSWCRASPDTYTSQLEIVTYHKLVQGCISTIMP